MPTDEKHINYSILQTYQIKDKGTVYIVENDKDRNRKENDLIGSTVLIGGKKYIVKGIESHAVPVIMKGDRIGLLIYQLEK